MTLDKLDRFFDDIHRAVNHYVGSSPTIVVVDNTGDPLPIKEIPKEYAEHGFGAPFPQDADKKIWSSIAVVTQKTSLQEPSSEGPLVINQTVSKNGKAVVLQEGDVILVFPQRWDINYDGSNEFVQYIGKKGDTEHRGSYFPRVAIEWIYHYPGGRL